MSQNHEVFIPFARPTLDEEMIQAVADTLRSHWITTGPKVQALEHALSEFHGGRSVRLFNSATSGLEVALLTLNIGPGDEVIIPGQTFFSCANVITRVGASPVFVDIDPTTRNLDLTLTEQAISPRTKVIMPTHFAGLPLPMDNLYNLAQHHQIRVIEDAALAIGSSWQGQRIGSFGDIVSFSFHPNKNITTIEGGALVFSNPEEAKRAEYFRFHGIQKCADGTRDVIVPGGKYNLPDVNAQLGLLQLARLTEFNATRQKLVKIYFQELSDFSLCELPHLGHEGHSWNFFAPLLKLEQLTASRHTIMQELHHQGIGTGISYEATHLTQYYRHLGYKPGDLPVSEKVSAQTLTLPLYPTLTEDQLHRVCHTFKKTLINYAR